VGILSHILKRGRRCGGTPARGPVHLYEGYMKSDSAIEGCGSELTALRVVTKERPQGVLLHVCPVCDAPE
jgi:hypothetical protein